jgi:hypothetical protein
MEELKLYNSNTTCELNIMAKSKQGCVLSNYYAVAAFIKTYKWIFFIIGLVVGFFLTFLGSKIYTITLILTAVIATIGGIFALLFIFIGLHQIPDWAMWLILVLSIIISIAVGYLFYKMKKVFLGVLGGLTGYMVGLTVYTFVLRYIKSNPTVVFYVTIVVFIILGFLFAYFLEKHLIITATTFIGSYLTIRAASLVIGGFPSESEIVDLMKREEYDQVSEVSY